MQLLGRVKPKDQKLKACLSYSEQFKLSLGSFERPCLETEGKERAGAELGGNLAPRMPWVWS